MTDSMPGQRRVRIALESSARVDEIIPREIIPEAIVSLIDVAPEPVRVAPKRRHAREEDLQKIGGCSEEAGGLSEALPYFPTPSSVQLLFGIGPWLLQGATSPSTPAEG